MTKKCVAELTRCEDEGVKIVIISCNIRLDSRDSISIRLREMESLAQRGLERWSEVRKHTDSQQVQKLSNRDNNGKR